MEEKEKTKSGFSFSAMVFIGCMFIGGGIGMIFNRPEIGGSIGMGVGFIAMGAIWAFYKKK
jgi:uncharacterized membrane protein